MTRPSFGKIWLIPVNISDVIWRIDGPYLQVVKKAKYSIESLRLYGKCQTEPDPMPANLFGLSKPSLVVALTEKGLQNVSAACQYSKRNVFQFLALLKNNEVVM